MSGVQQRQVESDEDGMRLDRWFAHHFPQLGFGRLQKLIRNGEVKVDKAKVTTSTRLSPGQTVRIPPIDDADTVKPVKVNEDDARLIADMILYEDDDIYVLNKPHGLAVQGGTGTKRHLDGMLKSLPNKKGEPPRLVHRLD
ncbi:MAG: RluA family pseudouridine synthase, partial [Alphaproteobacteria bacterium]|nr:RluA family pseudouridine synthase [Alphaproteobacteria bacterium]